MLLFLLHWYLQARINLGGLGAEPPIAIMHKSVLGINRKLCVSQAPIAHRHCPFFGYLGNAHINDLAYKVISGENRLGFSEFSYPSMVTLNGICRVYYLPDLLRIFEECRKFNPFFAP